MSASREINQIGLTIQYYNILIAFAPGSMMTCEQARLSEGVSLLSHQQLQPLGDHRIAHRWRLWLLLLSYTLPGVKPNFRDVRVDTDSARVRSSSASRNWLIDTMQIRRTSWQISTNQSNHIYLARYNSAERWLAHLAFTDILRENASAFFHWWAFFRSIEPPVWRSSSRRLNHASQSDDQ